jgi:hypothetical protein
MMGIPLLWAQRGSETLINHPELDALTDQLYPSSGGVWLGLAIIAGGLLFAFCHLFRKVD